MTGDRRSMTASANSRDVGETWNTGVESGGLDA